MGRPLVRRGRAFRCLLDGLKPERIRLAHEALGIGRAAIGRAVRYAKERVVFDRLFGQNQGIAFPFAEAVTRLNAAELMARNAAWRYDKGLPCGREANMAKWLCADAGSAADQGCPDSRRHGLRQGVPRRTVLPRVTHSSPRAGEPGDGHELSVDPRARPAKVVLSGECGFPQAGRRAQGTSGELIEFSVNI